MANNNNNQDDMIVIDTEELTEFVIKETGLDKDIVDKVLFAYDKYLIKIGALDEKAYEVQDIIRRMNELETIRHFFIYQSNVESTFTI